MKRFTNSRKFLFGIAVSMVLAMAIGSFALSETQTPASPQEVEAQSAVGATAGPFTVDGGTQGTDFDYTSPVLTIHSGNLTISTNGETTERIVVDGAATITLAGVNIDRTSETEATAPITIADNATFDVNILLADGSTNILKGKAGSSLSNPGSPGIEKSDDGSVDIDTLGALTIGVPDGSAGTGKLQANGGFCGAGIGGGDQESGSNITITGGEVTATGGKCGAGIGCGYYGSASNITITGGKVTATGGYNGAGIGGGENGSGSNIIITGGEVTANGGESASGIGGGYWAAGSHIIISGGEVTANGGRNYGAGIGGGNDGSASNITINGGEVTAYGGYRAAGIGGGEYGDGSDITISGGEVTAFGGSYGAGIGGGDYQNGSNITIDGGVIKACGGRDVAAGIGGGRGGGGSGNSLNGDAVVLATSSDASRAALEGFVNTQQESLLIQGIAFTGLGTAFDDKGRTTDVTWDSNGTMYGDSVAMSQNANFPANLTIEDDKEITLEAGKTLTVSAGATLKNDGTITINNTGTINCQGTITTKTDFYLEDSTDVYATGYQTYQTSDGVQKYTNLPNPDQTFVNWYYIDQDGRKTKIDENSFVALNAHSFYENLYAISIAKQGEGEITPNVTEAARDDTVTFEATPADGYELKEESVTVTDADGNEVPVTEQDGKYTFTMPGADVEISAAFELIPEPSVDPDQSGDGSSKTGDSFAGIAALAILGLATTGAALLRKCK